jgi:hypothetical protein
MVDKNVKGSNKKELTPEQKQEQKYGIILGSIILGIALFIIGGISLDRAIFQETVASCKVEDKRDWNTRRGHSYRVETTCGKLTTHKETYDKVAVGKTYDFVKTGNISPVYELKSLKN